MAALGNGANLCYVDYLTQHRARPSCAGFASQVDHRVLLRM